MATLMESYEQQYSTLTAEITTKTGKIPNLSGSEKQQAISNVERLIEETRELLEQMDLEAREFPTKERQKYMTRLTSYKTEFTKLERDLKRARIAFSDEVHTREELMGSLDDGHNSEDQRTRLLDNTERAERSGRRLEQGYKTVLETEKKLDGCLIIKASVPSVLGKPKHEQIGSSILEDLHEQRNTMTRARERLRETNEALGKSSRVLTSMMRRIVQNRLLLIVLAITLVIVIGVAIYFATKKS